MRDLETPEGAVEWNGATYKTILSAKDTGGAMSIVDSVCPPGSGPPRHVHKDADETFVVLTGACEVWIEGETQHVAAGQSAFVPRGREHTFRITGSEPSRHLVILTPGGFEGFFQEMAEGQFRIPDDMQTIIGIAARYHMDFTGPPLNAD